MGINYYLAREDNRTLFALGKGAWDEPFYELTGSRRDWAAFALPDEVDLAAAISLVVENWDLDFAPDAYAAEIARRIVAFAGDQLVRLVNDASGFDCLYDHYVDERDELRVVDSRHTSDWGSWKPNSEINR
jgi:hypothetical protein